MTKLSCYYHGKNILVLPYLSISIPYNQTLKMLIQMKFSLDFLILALIFYRVFVVKITKSGYTADNMALFYIQIIYKLSCKRLFFSNFL